MQHYHAWKSNHCLLTSYGVRSGLSKARPQSIDNRGQATWTHLYAQITQKNCYQNIYKHKLHNNFKRYL